MRTLQRVLLTALLICASVPVFAEDIKSLIQAQNDAYGAAYRAGDAAAVAALHTENAILIGPNSPRVEGRAAVEEYIAAGLNLGDSDIKLTALEVTQHGDTAIEVGRYSSSLKPPYGAAIEDRGNYLVIWQRGDDGVWRLHIDAFNSELPLPE